MRIIFSKDRPAQLDLLLRSLQRYAPAEQTVVIYASSQSEYLLGYNELVTKWQDVAWWCEGEGTIAFGELLDAALELSGETVTFFCDDNVLYRRYNTRPVETLREDEQILTFSLRLGGSLGCWDWTKYPKYDHGYPGSIDGHVFRTEDVRWMLGEEQIENPLHLETVLALQVAKLAATRPLMACYRQQCLVGIDVNTVTDQGGKRPSGKVYPQSAVELNERFLAGERISLDALDLEDVTECLVERQFAWEPAP